jgi:hypothetical protein
MYLFITLLHLYKGSAIKRCSVLGGGAKVLKVVSLVKNISLGTCILYRLQKESYF